MMVNPEGFVVHNEYVSFDMPLITVVFQIGYEMEGRDIWSHQKMLLA
jgi:hypothetical protein